MRDTDHSRLNEGRAALICGCKPLLTNKSSEANGTPHLVLTTKNRRGQRLENHIKPIIKPIGKTHKTVKTEPFCLALFLVVNGLHPQINPAWLSLTLLWSASLTDSPNQNPGTSELGTKEFLAPSAVEERG